VIRYRYTGEGARGFDRFAGTHGAAFEVGLFRSMLRIRRIEEEIERRYRQDQRRRRSMDRQVRCRRVLAALEKSDLPFPSHRTYGNYLPARGD
jgi:TPP-dependent pyruvate/acetoin dehydrogenase alpha subunit